MIGKIVLTLSSAILVLLSVSGCSLNSPHVTSNEQKPITRTSQSSHIDGEIISLVPIQVPNTNSVRTFKMMYWSANAQAEAFLAVPQSAGTYPLYVSCHGGSSINTGTFGEVTPENQTSLENADPNFVTLIPEYRGYDDSGGTVHGLSGDTFDTNNAIKAVMSKFSVEKNHVYLAGVSMGGGVVLQLATERSDIRSVIAISPFVGWNIVGAWAVQNKNKSDMAWNEYGAMLTYGTDNPNSPLLKPESVDVQKLKVPVLLLQGTGDQSVPWQTVQTLYNDIKPYDSQIKLILFPDGQHGLHDKYQTQVNEDINSWYAIYGEQ